VTRESQTRVLVTGASRGIGQAIVLALSASTRYEVIGTSRRPSAIPHDERVPGVRYIELDLANAESIERCVAEVGDVEALISNAGQSQLGALEELDVGAVEKLFQINVFGPMRLIQLMLPSMRQRGGGTIIAIGSMISEFVVPFQSSYAASKLALRGLLEALRGEVAGFGVSVVVVEPLDIRTSISRETVLRSGSCYAPLVARVGHHIGESVAAARGPEVVASRVEWLMRSRPRRARYVVGPGGARLLLLRRLLPSALVERLVWKRYGVPTRAASRRKPWVA
jgi:short-subunit dehydrogenase